MGTFTSLPFQFQQRGPALADASKDPRLFAQFTESRDQDLEDYLAGLHGLPAGGTTGQVLAKHSDDDFDADWEDAGAGFDNKWFSFRAEIPSIASNAAFTQADGFTNALLRQSSGAGCFISTLGSPPTYTLAIPPGEWFVAYSVLLPLGHGTPSGGMRFIFDWTGSDMTLYQRRIDIHPYLSTQSPIGTGNSISGGVSGIVVPTESPVLFGFTAENSMNVAADEHPEFANIVDVSGVLLRNVYDQGDTTQP